MINLLAKNPFTIWANWLLHVWKTKRKYPTAKLHYNAFARNTSLGHRVTIYDNTTLLNCSVGDYTYFAGHCVFANTVVGKFCSIGPGVRSAPGDHPTHEYVSTHPVFYSVGMQAQITFADRAYVEENSPVLIGNDVWIGANAVILNGISIGDGAIIAAGAIVTKDVPAYAIIGGVPAKIIKYRFSADEIAFLLRYRWWDKSEKWLRENWRSFHAISDFLQRNI